MKYYISYRKWIGGVPAYRGKEFVELYRKVLNLVRKYIKVIPAFPLVRSEENLVDIISRIHLYE